MIEGFKKVIMRGNVVDLAVGVVVGAAFNTVVQQLTDSFLNPLVQLLSGGHEFSGTWRIREVVFTWGEFLNSVIAFFITAAALYFLVVLPMNTLAERRKRGEEPEPAAPSEEVRLLTEIRDALVRR